MQTQHKEENTTESIQHMLEMHVGKRCTQPREMTGVIQLIANYTLPSVIHPLKLNMAALHRTPGPDSWRTLTSSYPTSLQKAPCWSSSVLHTSRRRSQPLSCCFYHLLPSLTLVALPPTPVTNCSFCSPGTARPPTFLHLLVTSLPTSAPIALSPFLTLPNLYTKPLLHVPSPLST